MPIYSCILDMAHLAVWAIIQTFELWFSAKTRGVLFVCVIFLFRWFEELGPICELLEKASEIKSPIGSLFQKYVYSSFMVKMRIDLGTFGLFWFILGWG